MDDQSSSLVQPISARALSIEIQSRRMSPQEALALNEAAIAAHEEQVKAFVTRPKDAVINEGPLTGIAIGVKDIFDSHDMPSEYGSSIYQNHQTSSDASVVAMARNAGATISGKTVTTEFAWFSPGNTRNPHNLEHTPGGSSSGSAAGVAAGFFPAAIGSQTGGSMLRPASFCGVAGYKPSFRLFPTIGMKQFSWSLDTVGIFGAEVADAAFVAAAMSQRDLEVDMDNTTVPKIGIYRSPIDDQMDADMQSAIDTVSRWARKAGSPCKDVVAIDDVEKARAAHAGIQDFESALCLADELRRSSDGFTDKLKNYLLENAKLSPESYDHARRTANRARKASRALFDDCDVLLLPSAPGTAPKTLASTGDSVFNRLWTLLGVPAVNVSGMKGANGLPLGLQIVAPFGQDKQALQAAHWLETLIKSNQ